MTKKIPFYIKCLNFSVITSSVLIILLSILLIYANTGGNQDYAKILDMVSENLNKKPIEDIALTQTISCPSNYQKLIISQWPGTKSCEQEGQTSCPNYMGLPYQNISKWKSYEFCIKYVQEFQFISSNSSCNTGHKKCTTNLCVPATSACPLTKLSIQNTNIDPNGISKFLNWTNSMFLKLEIDSQASSSLIEITTHQKQNVCLDRNNWNFTKIEYPFEQLNVNFGCVKYGTFNNSQIDSQDSLDLYQENGVLNEINKIPGYNEFLQQKKSYLLSNSHLELKGQIHECQNIQLSKFSIIPKFSDLFFELSNSSGESVLLAIITFEAILIVSVSFTMLITKKRVNKDQCIRDWKKAIPFIWNPIFFIQFILIVAIYGNIQKTVNNIIKSSSYITKYEKFNCFQIIGVNKAIHDLDVYVDGFSKPAKTYSQIILSLILVRFLPYSIFYLIKYIQYKAKQKERKKKIPSDISSKSKNFEQFNSMSLKVDQKGNTLKPMSIYQADLRDIQLDLS